MDGFGYVSERTVPDQVSCPSTWLRQVIPTRTWTRPELEVSFLPLVLTKITKLQVWQWPRNLSSATFYLTIYCDCCPQFFLKTDQKPSFMSKFWFVELTANKAQMISRKSSSNFKWIKYVVAFLSNTWKSVLVWCLWDNNVYLSIPITSDK